MLPFNSSAGTSTHRRVSLRRKLATVEISNTHPDYFSCDNQLVAVMPRNRSGVSTMTDRTRSRSRTCAKRARDFAGMRMRRCQRVPTPFAEARRAAPDLPGRAREVFRRAQHVFGRAQYVFGRAKEVFGQARRIFGRAKEVFGRVNDALGRAKHVLGRSKHVPGPFADIR